MTQHARSETSTRKVENDLAKDVKQARGPADEDSIVEAVREGAAPSYESDAQWVDEDGNVVLSPTSLPQLTMPELQGLSPDDVVVPEEGDPALYGIDEDADENPVTRKSTERGQKVAEKFLDDTTDTSGRSGQRAKKDDKAARDAKKDDDKKDTKD